MGLTLIPSASPFSLAKSVTAGKIGAEAVKAGKLAKNAVANDRIQDGAVSSDARIWGRGWYFGKIAVDPKNADLVYISNTGVYRSRDGGRSTSPGVQISATSAKSRNTACNRSSISSVTRSSRNVAGAPRRARCCRIRSKARSNRMGAAFGFGAMPVGTPILPFLAIRAARAPAAKVARNYPRGKALIPTQMNLIRL